MHTRKHFAGVALCLIFLTGIIAPVPECYVTKLVCPLKKSLGAAHPGVRSASGPSESSGCCDQTDFSLTTASSHYIPVALKFGMKPYAPPFESAHAPLVPLSLPPVMFSRPAPEKILVFAFHDGRQKDLPDPIPILLRKQSFLI